MINCIDLGAVFFDAPLPVVVVCTSFEVRVVLSVVTLDIKGVCYSLASCLASLLASLLLFSSSFLFNSNCFFSSSFSFLFLFSSLCFSIILFSCSVFIDSLSLMGVLLARLLVDVSALLFLSLSCDLPCPAQRGSSVSISVCSLSLLMDTALLVLILTFYLHRYFILSTF